MNENYDDFVSDMTQAYERREMEATSYRHDVDRMFQELSKEHLVTLRDIIYHLISSPDDAHLGGYYEGCVSAALQYRFGICPGCGFNHDEELHSDVPPEEASEEVKKYPGLESTPMELMIKYNLDDLRDADTHQLLGFICKGCGMRYPSLQDRMLRAYDECSGCQQKAKFG